MTLRYHYLAACLMLTGLWLAALPGPATAGEPLDKIRATVNDVLEVIHNGQLKGPEHAEERRAKIRQAVLQRFGFEEMAKRALGRHWSKRTPQERQEFVDLFSDLLERSYISKIEGYGGTKQNIHYTKETIDDGYASVHSEIVNKRDVDVEVEYRLLQRHDDWQVYDVVIEGVSLVNNYRTQFNKIILEDSYAELVKKMQHKLEQEKASERG
jgi:phospholipid transport system substrate-binding protein